MKLSEKYTVSEKKHKYLLLFCAGEKNLKNFSVYASDCHVLVAV